MSYSLDTNVVVRLVIGTPEDQYARARTLIDRLEGIGQTALVSDVVIAEACHVLCTVYKVPRLEALEGLRDIFRDRAIRGESAPSVLAHPEAAVGKPGFVDRLILKRARDHHTTLLTFDRTLGALPGTEPLAGA
jgi:predicted nucleic acid-binding protein